MQEAGRILLMPKGDYAAGTTYTMLDLVNHNEASWVCKKDCTGQEPSDSNTEYWQRFGTAVDLSNYLPKKNGVIPKGSSLYFEKPDNSTLAGNVKIEVSGDYIRFSVNGGNSKGAVIKLSECLDWLGSVLLHSGNFSNYALPLTGGELGNTEPPILTLHRTNGTNARLRFKEKDVITGHLGTNGVDNPVFVNAEANKTYTLLHTGNKPTGTYTGNGDATQRTIQTNGIGSVLYVRNVTDRADSKYSFAIVTSNGYIGKDESGNFVSGQEAFIGGNASLVVKSTSPMFNKSGVSYEYGVL